MRRLFGALALALVAGVVALALSFRAEALPVGPIPKIEPPSARSPEGMRLSAIPAGTTKSVAAFAYRGGSFSDEREFQMGGILVEHSGGNLLFDTGFGRDVDRHAAENPWLMRAVSEYRKEETVADRMRAAGFDPASLRAIVLTHAHWDHVSGIPDLPGVKVWVTQAELDLIRSDHRAAALARSFGDVPWEVYDFPDGPYLGFERSHDVFHDGAVVIVPAPGHTPGSVIAFVTLPSGVRYALVGDLVWQKEGIEIPAERPWLARLLVDADAAGVWRWIVRMHELRNALPDLIIVPAHDTRVWATLPKLSAAP